EALDPTHFGGDDHQRILANYLREKYSETAIGAVVAVGSAALKFALRFRTTHWPDVPVVFALVDSETAATETLPAGVTGNTIKLSLASSVAAARALMPDVKRLVLIGDPLDTQPFRRHFKDEIGFLSVENQFVDLLGLPLRVVRERLATLPDDAVVIHTTINRDEGGTIVQPRDALAFVAQDA